MKHGFSKIILVMKLDVSVVQYVQCTSISAWICQNVPAGFFSFEADIAHIKWMGLVTSNLTAGGCVAAVSNALGWGG